MLGDVRSRPEREMKLHLSMYLTRDYCAVQRRQAYRFKVRIAPKRTSKAGACYGTRSTYGDIPPGSN